MPHLALPALSGYLRRRGHQVTQRDLNVEVFDEVLTRKHLRRAVEQVRRRFGAPERGSRFGPYASGRPLPYGCPDPEPVRWALEQGPQLAEKVEAAKATLRSPDFYRLEVAEPAFLTVVAALELNSLAYFPARLELTRFIDPGRPDASSDLLRAARNPQVNPFYDIFRRGILQDLLRDRPTLVGISIPTQGQFLASLTLAALIRDSGLKCHITAGGPHITMLREQLPKVPEVFNLFDSLVLFDGELPLLKLVEALEGVGDLSSVPNLVYRGSVSKKLSPSTGQIKSSFSVSSVPPRLISSSEIHINPPLSLPEIRDAQLGQPPDFDGLPLHLYLAPEPVLPLASTHGCYHGKCAFCNVGYGSPMHYFPHPVQQVADQMAEVGQKYGCRHIFLVDEAVTPATLRSLSAALARQGASLHWTGAVRLEKALSAPLLQEMASAGCRLLLFGLESASEPVMRRMMKGTQKEEMGRVLRDSATAGIWNHAFFFFGFPGETMADAQATVNFIYEHQDAIHSGSPGAFLLERYSPAHLQPEKFGIRRIHEDAERDLAIYFDYELEAGLDEVTANDLADRLVEQFPIKRYGMYYINDVFRFLYASELRRQGQPLPRWIE